jgi:CDP-paratose 2-epimerase
MRVLITGGLGAIGSRLAAHFAADGHEARVLDPGCGRRGDWTCTQLQALNLGILRQRVEEADLPALLAQADAVVHAAAHTGIPHSAEDPREDWQSNVEATRALLDALRAARRPPPTVVMSSVKPYRVGDLPVTRRGTRYEWTEARAGIPESWPLEPDEPYAASKLAQSALCQAYARSYGLPVVTLRFSNLYGPAACHGPRHGWLTWFCIAATLGREIQRQGDGCQARDMLFTSDIYSAVGAALARARELAGEVFNVGGGARNVVSVGEAVGLLQTELGLRFPVTPAPGRRHEDLLFITDHGKFSRATGWKPEVGVLDGMRQVVEWASRHRSALEGVYA